jgi:hypothetical protein
MSGIVPTNFKKNIWSEEHVYILGMVAEAMLLQYIYILTPTLRFTDKMSKSQTPNGQNVERQNV